MITNYITKYLKYLNQLARNWKLLSFRKLAVLPLIFNRREKRMLGLLLIAMIISGSGLFIRLYAGLTKPVPDIGGSYTEGSTKEPRTINPIYSSQDTDRDISRLVFSRLFYYDHTGELKPDLAEKYELTPDGKNYKVILRSGVRWHDGKPLTASDIVFTIQTIQKTIFRLIAQDDNAF